MSKEIPSQTPVGFDAESLMRQMKACDRYLLLDEGRIARLTVAELTVHPEAAGKILDTVYCFVFNEEGAVFDSQRTLSPTHNFIFDELFEVVDSRILPPAPRGQVSALNEIVHEKARHRMYYIQRGVILAIARQNAGKMPDADGLKCAIQGQVAKEAMEIAKSPS